MKEYVTIPDGKEFVSETVIEKSRFIACAVHVDDVEQAVEFVKQCKKKYYDATHNCYAYIVDDKAKFSDDGEPQGTAGQPMYECLKQMGLNRVCVVVTRYFGGVKLGAGGLVRAYGGAVVDVLNKTPRLNYVNCFTAKVTVEYSLYEPMRRAVSQHCNVTDVDFADKVTLSILGTADLENTITDIVTDISNGKAIYTSLGTTLYPYKHIVTY